MDRRVVTRPSSSSTTSSIPPRPSGGLQQVDLAGEPFVTTRPGIWVRTLLDRLFGDAGMRPTIVCEGTNEPGATLQVVKVGLGMAPVPAMGCHAATEEMPGPGWRPTTYVDPLRPE